MYNTQKVLKNILGREPTFLLDMNTEDEWYTQEMLYDDYIKNGHITCPNCFTSLDIDNPSCKNCGWQNQHLI